MGGIDRIIYFRNPDLPTGNFVVRGSISLSLSLSFVLPRRLLVTISSSLASTSYANVRRVETNDKIRNAKKVSIFSFQYSMYNTVQWTPLII